MIAPLVVGVLWIMFGGTHVGLATAPVRGRIVARVGEIGFIALFYLVAAVSFAALISYYAAHRFEGPAGLALSSLPALRWALVLLSITGIMLLVPALMVYPRLPSALFSQSIHSPYGIERITRHPFFAGSALFAMAHMLSATYLTGTVFFAGLAALAILGARHQDRKLCVRRGPAYAEYLAATSALPFAAIMSGRQRFVWRELPIGGLLLGAIMALLLRIWHDALFADHGAWIIAVFWVGALIAGGNAWRRQQRHAHTQRVTPGIGRQRARWTVGRLLMMTGIGHALVGVVLFRDALAAILHDGVFNAVAPHFDREAAFWFMLFSPVCLLLGQIVDRAVERHDATLLMLLGWNLLALGVIGVMAMPMSGFWILIALAPWVLKSARTTGPLAAAPPSAVHQSS